MVQMPSSCHLRVDWRNMQRGMEGLVREVTGLASQLEASLKDWEVSGLIQGEVSSSHLTEPSFSHFV